MNPKVDLNTHWSVGERIKRCVVWGDGPPQRRQQKGHRGKTGLRKGCANKQVSACSQGRGKEPTGPNPGGEGKKTSRQTALWLGGGQGGGGK